MNTAVQELASFAQYAQQRIDAGGENLSIDELFDCWRAEYPSAALYAENVAAIQESIRDFDAGERGTLAGEHSEELRRQIKAGR